MLRIRIWDPGSWIRCFFTPESRREKTPDPGSWIREWVGGCWVVSETIFCRRLTLCFWPDYADYEPTKLLDQPRQINTCRKVPLQVNFFRWRHLALLSVSLIFLQCTLSVNYLFSLRNYLVYPPLPPTLTWFPILISDRSGWRAKPIIFLHGVLSGTRGIPSGILWEG